MRRRIFHSTYALDRLISMSTGNAFSFTDDSASGVPLPDLGPDRELYSPSTIFLRSIKPSLYLFDIRRVQSAFYQTTRSSSRAQWSISQATNYASSISNDIHQWYSSIPTSLSQEHLTFFNIERLYSQVMVVASNQKMPIANMTELNKALVFEYSAQYMEQLHTVTMNVDYHAFVTYAELCRARWVGRQFLEVMWSDFDRLLKTQHLIVGSGSLGSSPQDNCNRAITCIVQGIEILDHAARRWQMPEMKERFEEQSAVLLARLRNRQQEFGMTGSPQQMSSQQPQPIWYGSGSTVPQMQSQQPYAPPNAVQNPGESTKSSATTSSPHALPQSSLPRRKYVFMGNNA